MRRYCRRQAGQVSRSGGASEVPRRLFGSWLIASRGRSAIGCVDESADNGPTEESRVGSNMRSPGRGEELGQVTYYPAGAAAKPAGRPLAHVAAPGPST